VPGAHRRGEGQQTNKGAAQPNGPVTAHGGSRKFAATCSDHVDSS
jgi:hypothetical protein